MIADRYVVRDELGRGGMGVVWRADDQVIGRTVALKELPTPPGFSPEEREIYLQRVLREARTAGRLNDPAVVTVYDVVSEGDSTYIVMELVSAPTLADVIKREGPLAGERVLAIAVQVLGALETAHAAGIVHRDVKPSNIMVLSGDRVKLADFGIARAMDDPSLTMTGGIMGSPGYMAPELFAGATPAAASDLWSLGATLFHAVEGRSPFSRTTTAATVHAIMYEQPELRRCGGRLARAIQGLLAPAVAERLTAPALRALFDGPESAGEQEPTQRVSADAPTEYIEAVTVAVPQAGGSPFERQGDTKPDPMGEEPTAPRRRRAVGWLSAAAAVAVVVALAAVFLFRPQSVDGAALAGAGPATSEGPATTTPTERSSSASSSPAPSSAASSTTLASEPVAPAAGDESGSHDPQHSAPAHEAGDEQAPDQGQEAAPGPERSLTVLTRYNHPDGAHFSGTGEVSPPPGFSSEAALGALVADPETGARKLYACKVSDVDDWFSSIDQSGGCEGQQTLGLLGYIFVDPPAGVSSLPVYRCNAGNSHFDSLLSSCEGEAKEFRLGYLLAG